MMRKGVFSLNMKRFCGKVEDRLTSKERKAGSGMISKRNSKFNE